MTDTTPSARGTNLVSYLPLLWKARLLLLISAAISAIVAFGVVAVRPPVYVATGVLVLPAASQGPSLIESLPFISKDATQLSILHGIATSQRAYREVSKLTKEPLRDLNENLKWKIDSQTNQLEVISHHENRAKAQAIADYAIGVTRKMALEVQSNLAMSNASELSAFLTKKQNELRETEAELLEFQKSLRAAPAGVGPTSALDYFARLKQIEIDLGKVEKQLEFERQVAVRRGEPAANLQAGPQNPTWKERVTQVEYDLRVAQTRLGPDAPEVEALRRKLRVTQNQLSSEIREYIRSVNSNLDAKVADLEAQRLALEYQRGIVAELAKIAPREALQLQRLVRETEARAQAVVEIRRQFELSKVDTEVKRVPYAILEQPIVEAEPVNKDWKRPALISAIIGLLVASACIILARLIRTIPPLPEP
ncbi:MAG: hypothetical protein SFX74_06050 [Fimbriimonadaceae bacterium]|nr:hypothetical protein [Fimbriimonadaceae bacterium]